MVKAVGTEKKKVNITEKQTPLPAGGRTLPSEGRAQTLSRPAADLSLQEGEEKREELRDGEKKRTRLGDRDRQLLMSLAEARMLSSRQVGELFFPARSENALRSRLRALELLGVVARTSSRRLEGAPEICWSLTAHGQRVVEGWLGEELPENATAQVDFVEHSVFCAELFVRLLSAPLAARVAKVDVNAGRLERQKQLGQLYARVEHRSWRWVGAGAALQLPWKEYSHGKAQDRLIRPDALLEFPRSKRRVFIEAETGSQPITSKNVRRLGATDAKLDRYLAYWTGLADAAARVTWYQQRFTDGFTPELVLLLPAGQRLKNVEAAIAAWRSKKPLAANLVIHALSAESAAARYGALTGGAAPVVATPRAEGGLPSPDIAVIREFFESTRTDLKRRQAAAAQHQRQMPTVPARYEDMKALVARLGGTS